jgi:hypothetical protein
MADCSCSLTAKSPWRSSLSIWACRMRCVMGWPTAVCSSRSRAASSRQEDCLSRSGGSLAR